MGFWVYGLLGIGAFGYTGFSVLKPFCQSWLETSHFAGICHPETKTTKIEKNCKLEKNWTRKWLIYWSEKVERSWKRRILPEFVIRSEQQVEKRSKK
jgi:hypothetical protein